MGVADAIGMVAKWSYLVISIVSILGAFVHLNIQFQVSRCSDSFLDSYELAYGAKGRCIGRSLIWLNSKTLDSDSNELVWRSVFTLSPDTFVDTWTPFFFGFLSLFQSFQGAKWNLISGSWVRVFLYIIFWMLFGVFGYGANFGVFLGFVGTLYLGLLYMIMIFVGSYEDDPVLQINLQRLVMKITGNGGRNRNDTAGAQTVPDNPNDGANNNNNYDNGGELGQQQQQYGS